MSTVRERYVPHAMAANTTYSIPQGRDSMGGFLCTVDGTLDAYAGDGTTKIVDTLVMVASTYYPIPAYLGNGGQAKVVLSGGAAGTLFL